MIYAKLKAINASNVSITDQVLKVSFTFKPKYSLTIQNPASLTWESIKEPAPVAITNNSKLTPDICWIMGDTIPAAVVNATVADPVATRISPATKNAKSSGEIERCSVICAIVSPTPVSISIYLNPPPAPIIKIIEPTGKIHSSTKSLITFLFIPCLNPNK